MLHVKDLRVEYREDPIGLDAKSPRFSWKLESDRREVFQVSYQIIVTEEESGRETWNSGENASADMVAVFYEGKALLPQTSYQVKVLVRDNCGEKAERTTTFRTGLMEPGNWKAHWITHGFADDLEACAVFEKNFSLRPGADGIREAYLYISALGIYEAVLNGQRVSDAYFAPGWTSYGSAIQYQTYDVLNLLGEENRMQVTVGNGWYKGILGFYNEGNHYGTRTALIAQLRVVYENGEDEWITTDESWTSTTGARRYSELYHGEVIDLTVGAQERRPAQRYEHTREVLIAQQNDPVRITERIPAKEVFRTPDGQIVIDFGQNLAGFVEARVCYPRGTRLTLRHGEALDENGNLYTGNLRTARATDVFVCSGGEDVFLPAFTYHGFRYVSVEGIEELPVKEAFCACVLHTDLRRTGSFVCDNEKVNQLWKNIDWTLRGNFMDIPTDCPQRDERFGYTGDAQIFSGTAVCLRDVLTFFEKWLRDLRADQAADGGIPTETPIISGANSSGIAIWHDAATVVPWTLYQAYGDKRILEQQFDSMAACVEFTRKRADADGLVHQGQQLADWVAMDVERGPLHRYDEKPLNLGVNEKVGSTDVYFIANAYYLYSVWITAQAAKILGREREALEYGKLYRRILSAMREEYFTKTGRMVSETQTAYAIALWFHIVLEEHRKKLVEGLRANLLKHENHLTTGFAGTQFLCKVLSEEGLHDVAGKVFLKEDCPSWFYSINLGATTVWELWDGVKPDGSFANYEMNSLNQYAFASIGEWMMKYLAGLSALEPGYRKARIAPRLIQGITELNGSLETPYGRLSCELSCRDHRYQIRIRIPENTVAEISLPGRAAEELGSGTYEFSYETTDCFEKQPYDMDTTFGELLKHPLAMELMEQYGKELLNNGMFMQFAVQQRMETVLSMLPEEAKGLFTMMMEKCNAAGPGSSEQNDNM